jgi:hypothetical protein
MNETCNKIIYLLLDRENWVSYDIIKNQITDQEQYLIMDSAKEELYRLKIINIILDDKELERYKIPQPIKNEIRFLPKQYENNPYGYFEYRERKQKYLEERKTEVDLNNAERVYNSYPSTRIMAIIACVVSVCLLFLKLAEVLKIWPYK